jgi:hypothetical protein
MKLWAACPDGISSTGFAGIVGVVSAWAIWGGDMFPQEQQLRQRPSSSQPRQKSKTEPATEPAQDIEAVLEARGGTYNCR